MRVPFHGHKTAFANSNCKLLPLTAVSSFSTHCRRHHLLFPPGLLNRFFERLIACDPRLHALALASSSLTLPVKPLPPLPPPVSPDVSAGSPPRTDPQFVIPPFACMAPPPMAVSLLPPLPPPPPPVPQAFKHSVVPPHVPVEGLMGSTVAPVVASSKGGLGTSSRGSESLILPQSVSPTFTVWPLMPAPEAAQQNRRAGQLQELYQQQQQKQQQLPPQEACVAPKFPSAEVPVMYPRRRTRLPSIESMPLPPSHLGGVCPAPPWLEPGQVRSLSGNQHLAELMRMLEEGEGTYTRSQLSGHALYLAQWQKQQGARHTTTGVSAYGQSRRNPKEMTPAVGEDVGVSELAAPAFDRREEHFGAWETSRMERTALNPVTHGSMQLPSPKPNTKEVIKLRMEQGEWATPSLFEVFSPGPSFPMATPNHRLKAVEAVYSYSPMLVDMAVSTN